MMSPIVEVMPRTGRGTQAEHEAGADRSEMLGGSR
jgi:hypothetical protein